MKLSKKLKNFRTDRPDEWTMDAFAQHAIEMEEALTFYGLEAMAIHTFMDINDNAVVASLSVLSLDAGNRARDLEVIR